MLSRLISFSLEALHCQKIMIEIDIKKGLPGITITGFTDKVIQESKDRIRTALINSGFTFPLKRVLIHLSPADIRKFGSHFDLPICMAFLLATSQINDEYDTDHNKINYNSGDKIFIGEVNLAGEVNWIRGLLPIVLEGVRNGYTDFIIPEQNAEEVRSLYFANFYTVKTIQECVELYENKFSKAKLSCSQSSIRKDENELDLKDVKGQVFAKRGLEIGAAGGHHIFLIGPPGAGKTMLADRITSITPKLSFSEQLDVSQIYSCAGLLGKDGLIKKRIIRKPHHQISVRGMTGGGVRMQPGEITLAHLGVLLMDEFPEFHNDVIQSLRTPIEKKMIHISRREGQVVFPADFLLLATANPCPCGNLGDEKRHCICSINDIMRYRKKLSGPIIDRIDLQIFVPRLNFTDISGQHNNAHSIQSSQKVFEKVISARERQKIRFKDQIFKTNANMNIAFIEKYVPLNRALKILMKDFMNKWLLSSRAYHSLLRISRTIADLSDVSDVKEEHLYEAFQYRSLDIENYDFIRKYHLN